MEENVLCFVVLFCCRTIIVLFTKNSLEFLALLGFAESGMSFFNQGRNF